MTKKIPVVGLMRHSASETGGSLAWYFRSLEQGLKELAGDDIRFLRLPGYYTQLGLKQCQAVMDDFLAQCDIVLVSTGGKIEHVVFPFSRRVELGLTIPIIYNPLGEFPRGAHGFLHAGPHFTSKDSIVFSCSADQEIYHSLIKSVVCKDYLSHFGIDTDHFTPQDTLEQKKLRKYLGLPENAFLLLYVGRITAEKNIHGLIDVFHQLVKKHENVYLLLVGEVKDVGFVEFGSGPYDLKEMFIENIPKPLWQRLKFFGAVGYEELPLFYSTADVFVNLTVHHDENFGYTQVEAMSSGCPVVASDWGGIKDTVIDKVTGFKVPCHVTDHGVRPDRSYAVELIESLINDQALCKSISVKAREHVVANLRVDRHCQDIFKLIKQSIDTQDDRIEVKNSLSELGKIAHKLIRENLQAKHVAKSSGKTAPSLFTTGEGSYDVYRKLVGPYATNDVESLLPIVNYAIQLASPWYQLSETKFTCHDPLWSFDYEFETELEYRILQVVDHYVQEVGKQLEQEDLYAELDVEENKVDDTVNKLIKRGILLPVGRQV